MNASRQVFTVPLHPLAGDRFQPTGFPDLGAAVYERPGPGGNWERAILVESAQSMANHLEAIGWDEGAQAPVRALDGLGWVRVLAAGDGRFLTSSRLEAHRLASAFVKDSTLNGCGMRDVIRERLDLRDDTPLSPRHIAAAVFALDPLCLLHGVFFAEKATVWPGQPKIARAVTGSIEAFGVREVLSGGAKRDHVRHSASEGGGSAEGYGSVIFHRTEFVAREIQATFVLDLAQLASYGLPDPGAELLAVLARWQIASLLETGLRLRTACDLVPVENMIADAEGELLPSSTELAVELGKLTAQAADLLGERGPLDVQWTPPSPPVKKKASSSEAEESSSSANNEGGK